MTLMPCKKLVSFPSHVCVDVTYMHLALVEVGTAHTSRDDMLGSQYSKVVHRPAAECVGLVREATLGLTPGPANQNLHF